MSERPQSPEPDVLRQIEEAFALLRGAGLATLAGYVAATVPFAGLAAWWWADSSWGPASPPRAAAWAAVLMAMFLVMRCGQAWFMARLWHRCLGQTPPGWTLARWRRAALHLSVSQPAQWFLLPLAAVLLVPAPGCLAFQQNATLLAGLGEQPLAPSLRRALRLSLPWFATLGSGKFLLGIIGLAVFLNLLVLVALAIQLADSFAGVELAQGFTVVHLFNTTTWVILLLVSYVIVDPLLRAWTVWRSFHLEALANGADLRTALRSASARRRLAAPTRLIAVALFALLALQSGTTRLHAEETIAAPEETLTVEGSEQPVAAPSPLDPDIERVLERSEFRWRLPTNQEKSKPGWWSDFGDWLSRRLKDFEDWMRRLKRWLDGKPKPPVEGVLPATGFSLTNIALYGALAVAALLLLWVLVRALRQRRAERATAPAGPAPVRAAASVSDLEREDTHAADQPSDEWARLAAELAARGEWRLALRAWHLATVARFGERGLVTVRRSKSDADYERELRRRGIATVLERFGRQRREFECRWYGRTPTEPVTVEAFSKPWELP